MVNCYSCWTYVSNQAKFNGTTYFANKLVSTWLSSIEMSDFKRKNVFP